MRSGSLKFCVAISISFLTATMLGGLGVSSLFAQSPPGALLTDGRSFSLNEKTVSTSVFVWYLLNGGQVSGPWEPLGGRSSWTGEVPYWKDQIKQIMTANIDIMNVHLFNGFGQQRTNLFQAMSELREEGYEVPKVTPFLDPLIAFGDGNTVNVATTAGKDTFVNRYKQFYDQYFSMNTDAKADSYLTRVDNRTVLDTWHTHLSLSNSGSLTRADVQTRLQAEYGAQHPVFNDDIYMITTNDTNGATLTFSDEKISQFQSFNYYEPTTWNGLQTVQLKPGYWDQNIRVPGTFRTRDGGTQYTNAWNQAVANKATVDRVYVESWNEYDEGTGIYAAKAQPPIIGPNNTSGNTDTWSNTNDPFEYIKTTAEGARQFNDTPDLDSTILWHNFPEAMLAGQTVTAQMIVRNSGDISWTNADSFSLGQNEILDAALFGTGRYLIDDTANEIPTYGGIFRGRPIVFDVELTAPLVGGNYVTRWQMLQEGNTRFGEELARTITVIDATGDVNQDGFLTEADVTAFVAGWGSTNLPPSLASYMQGDLNLDGQTDLADAILLDRAFRIAGLSFDFSALTQVPEPSARALLVLGSLCMCWISKETVR